MATALAQLELEQSARSKALPRNALPSRLSLAFSEQKQSQFQLNGDRLPLILRTHNSVRRRPLIGVCLQVGDCGSIWSGGRFEMSRYLTHFVPSARTSSVRMWNDSSRLTPKVVVIATSAASRPLATSTRPILGVLFLASTAYQRPPR